MRNLCEPKIVSKTYICIPNDKSKRSKKLKKQKEGYIWFLNVYGTTLLFVLLLKHLKINAHQVNFKIYAGCMVSVFCKMQQGPWGLKLYPGARTSIR